MPSQAGSVGIADEDEVDPTIARISVRCQGQIRTHGSDSEGLDSDVSTRAFGHHPPIASRHHSGVLVNPCPDAGTRLGGGSPDAGCCSVLCRRPLDRRPWPRPLWCPAPVATRPSYVVPLTACPLGWAERPRSDSLRSARRSTGTQQGTAARQGCAAGLRGRAARQGAVPSPSARRSTRSPRAGGGRAALARAQGEGLRRPCAIFHRSFQSRRGATTPSTRAGQTRWEE
jgi:hypothetical protein